MQLIILKIICKNKIPTSNLFNNFSTLLIFNIGSFAFFINLQLCPVYITIPMVHFVLRNLAPFNNKFFASKGNSFPTPFKRIFALPFNVYNEGFGKSHWIIPLMFIILLLLDILFCWS